MLYPSKFYYTWNKSHIKSLFSKVNNIMAYLHIYN